MQKRDFETYQKRFRDFEILQKFSETHVFQGTIRHPYWSASNWMCTDKREWAKLLGLQGWTVPAMLPYLWPLID